jgi:spermidine synthase
MRFSESPIAGLEIAYEGEPVHEERSSFQRIQVFDHPTFGRMLVLDGLVQTTERDEFFYHEMLVHVPLISHPEPKRVLIIGAGDGGALRRVLEHPSVQHVTMVEIDERVTVVSREYLPSISAGALDDSRAEVRFEDGHAFVLDSRDTYDAIVVDSSDPVGPGVVLFSAAFYQACLERLSPDGVFSAQIGTPTLFPGEIRMALSNARAAFPVVRPYLGAVPTYPGTLWAYMVAGRALDIETDEIRRRAGERGIEGSYWTPGVHVAAFELPRFVADLAAGGSSPFET